MCHKFQCHKHLMNGLQENHALVQSLVIVHWQPTLWTPAGSVALNYLGKDGFWILEICDKKAHKRKEIDKSPSTHNKHEKKMRTTLYMYCADGVGV